MHERQQNAGQMTEISYRRTPPLDNETLNALFAAAWPTHRQRDFRPVLQRSLVYIAAFQDTRLVGFVNVAWDGGVHGFVLDTIVHPDVRRRGIGLALLREAAEAASESGLEWLHVDFVKELEPFYRAAGYRDTVAGLLDLRGDLDG